MRDLLFLHASPGAILPLGNYYRAHAPEYRITNLLDDALLRCFAAGNEPAAERRLLALIEHAIRHSGVEAGLVTCTAAGPDMLRRLTRAAGLPLVKIDEPLARRAVATGRRLGVVVTFPPARQGTEDLLRAEAARTGVDLQLNVVVNEEAYRALLAGRHAEHDEMVREAALSLASGNDAVVLSQVSMATVLDQLPPGLNVLSSLPLSLEAIREVLPT
jgi:Asp/Glu/hydantoin racemase